MRQREGIEPRNIRHVNADVVCNTEGKTAGAKDQGSVGSTGV